MHDKANGDRWHRWTDEKGYRFASPCPKAATKAVDKDQARRESDERDAESWRDR